MSNVIVNLHDYCSKLVNLPQLYKDWCGSLIFREKPYKFYTFFYYTQINVNALKLHGQSWGILTIQKQMPFKRSVLAQGTHKDPA